ncbi:zinc-dependent metalloprotease [uncultured Flavobacterium sp.]|mgnify:CR=1 FL=1|uniref:zinc-dependent metalloprotease n=1 Tax=uncultured Flavobacterium sp. TaxID=165435 RepID=UPI0030EDC771|tara:strand:+ start:234405 stop:236660 length:2256 start_codon:yes stop_codon:yes gene_type:complete
MKNKYLLFLFFSIVFQGIAQNRISFSEKNSNEFNLSKNFKSYKILEIDDKLQRISDGEEIIIALDKEYIFKLKENRVISDNHILSIKNSSGIERKHLDEIGFDGKYFLNYSNSNSQLAFSMFEDRYSLYIKNPSKEFYIESLQNFDKNATSNLYIYYEVKDIIKETTLTCGLQNQEKKSPISNQKSTATGGCKTVDINFAVDYSMYATYGSISGAINRTLELINLSQVNYTIVNGLSDDVNFKVNEHFIVTCNDCNNWTTTLDIYENYNNFSWNANQMFSNPYDIKVLFQNQGGPGSVIGLGSLNMCNTSGTSVVKNYVSNSDYTRNILSHELGHNFGCQHTTGFIMNPSINSSNNWAPESITTINNSINTLSCIANCISEPCYNQKVSNIDVSYETVGNTINATWLAEIGVSQKIRLYNYATSSWTAFTTLNYPANSISFPFSQTNCNDKYRIEITPICSSINGITEQIVFIVSQNVTAPKLTFYSGSNQPICGSQTAYFGVTAVDGGTNPLYQWKVNGIDVGANQNTYSTTSLQNNDVVSCNLTSNAACVNSPYASVSTTVSIVAPTVLSVTITANVTTICAGDSVTLNATGVNINSPFPYYNWTFNGNYIQGGGSGQVSGPIISHTPTESGVYMCNLNDGEGCHTVEGSVQSNSISVTVLPQPCNLAMDTFDISGLNYYPNPVKNKLTISAKELISTINVYTVVGQKIMSLNINSDTTTIDLSNLSSGTYFINIEANGKSTFRNIIKE